MTTVRGPPSSRSWSWAAPLRSPAPARRWTASSSREATRPTGSLPAGRSGWCGARPSPMAPRSTSRSRWCRRSGMPDTPRPGPWSRPARHPSTRERVELVVAVTPGPRVAVKFEGDRPPSVTRRTIAGLYRIDAYEAASREEMRVATVRALRSLGFLDPRVEIAVAPGEPRVVTVTSTGGQQVGIEQVVFAGLPQEETGLLARRFAGPTERTELAAGLPDARRRVEDSLHALGFPEGRLVAQRVSEDGKRLDVELAPGPQDRIASVEVQGVDAALIEEVTGRLPLRAGSPGTRRPGGRGRGPDRADACRRRGSPTCACAPCERPPRREPWPCATRPASAGPSSSPRCSSPDSGPPGRDGCDAPPACSLEIPTTPCAWGRRAAACWAPTSSRSSRPRPPTGPTVASTSPSRCRRSRASRLPTASGGRARWGGAASWTSSTATCWGAPWWRACGPGGSPTTAPDGCTWRRRGCSAPARRSRPTWRLAESSTRTASSPTAAPAPCSSPDPSAAP